MSISETTAFSAPKSANAANEFQYQTVSKSAVSSVVFAVLGLAAFLAQAFVLLPFVGICFGVSALMNIKRYPEELVGKNLARIGLVASSLVFVTSTSMHVYVYLTEVPPGYTRMSFSQLKPERGRNAAFSRASEELDGKKVFLKGYVRPGAKKVNLKNFILVGDFGDCCFGGNVDIAEVVAINIKTDETVNHSLYLRRIGGVFKLNPNGRQVDEKDIPQVFYQIEADYIR